MTSEERCKSLERYLAYSSADDDPYADTLRSLIADSRLLRELVEKLPKCSKCDFKATVRQSIFLVCDHHAAVMAAQIDLPYADILRRLDHG